MKELRNIIKTKDENYKAFEEKFKHKVTTDDCYTPEPVYEVIKNYVIDYYKLGNVKIERPFYPGGDYKNYEYSENSVVIDNPPFSILAEIKRFYIKHNIKFFLFAPSLTLFSGHIGGLSYVVVNVPIIYENKAKVNTSYITNMDEYIVRTDPKLNVLINDIQKNTQNSLPKYIYPNNVITSAQIGKYASNGCEIKIMKDECEFISKLDSQKPLGKTLFGSGILINNKIADELAFKAQEFENSKTIIWELSEREKDIIKGLEV